MDSIITIAGYAGIALTCLVAAAGTAFMLRDIAGGLYRSYMSGVLVRAVAALSVVAAGAFMLYSTWTVLEGMRGEAMHSVFGGVFVITIVMLLVCFADEVLENTVSWVEGTKPSEQ